MKKKTVEPQRQPAGEKVRFGILIARDLMDAAKKRAAGENKTACLWIAEAIERVVRDGSDEALEAVLLEARKAVSVALYNRLINLRRALARLDGRGNGGTK